MKPGDRPAFGPDTLFFGIGNSGRSDDGLGWAFLERLQQLDGFIGQAEFRYQLAVEDAALVARADRVVFIDAYRGQLADGFRWQRCTASENFEFTTHVLPPRAVMHYCSDLYGKAPRADLLMIQGVCWDLAQGLSARGLRNLGHALTFLAGKAGLTLTA